MRAPAIAAVVLLLLSVAVTAIPLEKDTPAAPVTKEESKTPAVASVEDAGAEPKATASAPAPQEDESKTEPPHAQQEEVEATQTQAPVKSAAKSLMVETSSKTQFTELHPPVVVTNPSGVTVSTTGTDCTPTNSRTCYRHDSRSYYNPSPDGIIKLKFCNMYDIAVNMYWVGAPGGGSSIFARFYTSPSSKGQEFFVMTLAKDGEPQSCIEVDSYVEYAFRFRAAEPDEAEPTTYQRAIAVNDELFFFVTKSWHTQSPAAVAQGRGCVVQPNGVCAHEVYFSEQDQNTNYAYGNLDLITCPYTAALVKWGLINPDKQGLVDLDDFAKALRRTRAFFGAHRMASIKGETGAKTWRDKIDDCADADMSVDANWPSWSLTTAPGISPCSNLRSADGTKYFANVYDMDMSVFEHDGGDTKTRDPYFDADQMQTLMHETYGVSGSTYLNAVDLNFTMTEYDRKHNGDIFQSSIGQTAPMMHAGRKTIAEITLVSLGSNGVHGTHDTEIHKCTPRGRKGFHSSSLFTELYQNNDLTQGLPIWKCDAAANPDTSDETDGDGCTFLGFSADLPRTTVINAASGECCDVPSKNSYPCTVFDTRPGYLAMGGNVENPQFMSGLNEARAECEKMEKERRGLVGSSNEKYQGCTGITYNGNTWPNTVWFKNVESSGPWGGPTSSWRTDYQCQVARCYPSNAANAESC